MRKRSARRKKLLYYFIGGIITIALFLYSLSFFKKKVLSLSFFRIKKVEIKGNIEEDLKEKLISLLIDKSIFLDLSSLRKKILIQTPSIKEIKILKVFPSKVIVEVIRAIPFLQIEDEDIYVIDKEGEVIQIAKKPLKDIPLLKIGRVKKKFHLGEVIKDKRVKKAISFYIFLKKKTKFSPEIILAYHPTTFAFVEGGTKIILGEGEWEKKLNILEVLLKNKFRSNLTDFQYIDLREKKIYIRKKQ